MLPPQEPVAPSRKFRATITLHNSRGDSQWSTGRLESFANSYPESCRENFSSVKFRRARDFLPCALLYIVGNNRVIDGSLVAPLNAGGGSEPRIPLGD
jgi:hypothetical protein